MSQDIIPNNGFVYKPSVIWPVQPLPKGDGRIVPTESHPPPRPGHADTLRPSNERVAADSVSQRSTCEGISQSEMLGERTNDPSTLAASDSEANTQNQTQDIKWVPKPPKVLMEDPSATPLELRSQIQMYATNEYVYTLLN